MRPALEIHPARPNAGRMDATSLARLIGAGFTMLGFLASPSWAQKILMVVDDGKPAMVVSADGPEAMVEKNGKLVFAKGQGFGLLDASEYIPYVVKVTESNVETVSIKLDGGSGSTNNRLKVSLTLESPVELENAFVVLDLSTEAGKALFLWGVRTLLAGEPSRISIVLPSSVDLGASRYYTHVFSNGAELLNSTMSLDYINGWYEGMMRKRIEGVTHQALGVMVHPAPIYPADLKKKKVKGQAVISVNITKTGFVLDAALKSATDPAFGQAALVAVRQWWFLPPVRDGVPSGAKADIPINFN